MKSIRFDIETHLKKARILRDKIEMVNLDPLADHLFLDNERVKELSSQSKKQTKFLITLDEYIQKLLNVSLSNAGRLPR